MRCWVSVGQLRIASGVSDRPRCAYENAPAYHHLLSLDVPPGKYPGSDAVASRLRLFSAKPRMGPFPGSRRTRIVGLLLASLRLGRLRLRAGIAPAQKIELKRRLSGRRSDVVTRTCLTWCRCLLLRQRFLRNARIPQAAASWQAALPAAARARTPHPRDIDAISCARANDGLKRSMADEAAPPARPRRRARRAPWQPSPTDPTEPTISARALAKARGTVEDFARSYMPLLGPCRSTTCCASRTAFILSPAAVYELDELNERGGDPSQAPAAAALRQFLAGRGLLDDVQATLDVGFEYWTLERRLIAEWKRPLGDAAHEDELLRCACRASACKSFDYPSSFCSSRASRAVPSAKK